MKPASMLPGERAETVSALERGVALLRCFDEQVLSLSAVDLAAMTAIPRPSVIRLAGTLCALGLMRVTPEGDRYSLGPALVSLSHAFLAGLDQRSLFRQLMQPLADETQGSLYLAMRDGLEMVVIEACRARGSMLSARVDTGTRTPLATSALGRAYLLGLDQAQRETLMAELKKKSGESWLAVRQPLQDALALSAQTGYCVSIGTFHPDINSVSIPLKGPTGEVFSVNCGGAAFYFPEHRLIQEVVPRLYRLTKDLAQAIGGSMVSAHQESSSCI
jgi:DNA-binding IclR family transcriptional regulator